MDSNTQEDGPFGNFARQIISNGYKVTPVLGKAPCLPSWTTREITETDIEVHRNRNLGVLGRTTAAIDADVLDAKLSAALRAFLLQRFPWLRHGPERIGKAPKWLRPCRASEPFSKMQARFHADGKTDWAVEILGNGQQWVAAGTHPDTGRPYVWTGGDLTEVRRDDLPELTPARAHAVMAAVREFARERGYLEGKNGVAVDEMGPGAIVRRREPHPYTSTVNGLPGLVLRCLQALDPDDRGSWVGVGMHLKATRAEWAYPAWVEWSQQSSRYQPGDEERWQTFEPRPGAGIYHLTVAAGADDRIEDVNPLDDWEAPVSRETKRRANLIEWPERFEARPVNWAIKGWMERNSVGILWGEPGTYKSFVAIDWALSLVYRLPWLGQFEIVGPGGPAVFIVGEGRAGIERRISAWQLEHGVPVGENPGQSIGISRGAIMLNAPAADRRRTVDTLIEQVREMSRCPAIVVVDTLARNSIGDENAQQDMNALMAAADQIREAFPGSILLFVHHANKQGGIRGSVVIPGAVDFNYRLERRPGEKSVTIVNEKMKEAEPPLPYRLRAKLVHIGVAEDANGEPETIDSLVMEIMEPVQEDSMESRVVEAVRKLRLFGRVTGNDVFQFLGGNRNRVLAMVREAVEDGSLKRENGTLFVADDEMFE